MSLLHGIRVVEMGLWVAGPSAGGILADWGADVIKLEMLSGDPMRNLYSAMSGSKESRCPPFDMHNRGKRSVALDVNRAEGQALAHRLVSTADVFLTNMRPQFLRRANLQSRAIARGESEARVRHPDRLRSRGSGQGCAGLRPRGVQRAQRVERPRNRARRRAAHAARRPRRPGHGDHARGGRAWRPLVPRPNGTRPARVHVAAAHRHLLHWHGDVDAGSDSAASRPRRRAYPRKTR